MVLVNERRGPIISVIPIVTTYVVRCSTSTKSVYIQDRLPKMGEREASQKQTSIFFTDVTVEWRV